MKVAYLGPQGSFSYVAAEKAYAWVEYVPYPSITDCLVAIEDGAVDTAVVPIENSVQGTVTETLDVLFHQSNLSAACELVLPVFQQFLVAPQNEMKLLIKILSHPQAISQSQKFLREHYPNVPVWHTPSTANAAEYVANHPEEPVAAIGSARLAEQYGLLILHSDIQEMAANQTRFWVFGKQPTRSFSVSERKCSLAFTLKKNEPGALYLALSIFASHGINLTKIESRPLRTMLGEYFFLVDMVEDEELSEAVKELRALGELVKILGNYDVVRL